MIFEQTKKTSKEFYLELLLNLNKLHFSLWEYK